MKYPSKTFFTADLHFNHKSILRHCKRPFKDLDDMNQSLIKNWNEIVKPGCTVYIIGDFAWKDHAKFANKLNGKKILITGNHDKMSHEAMKPFTEIHPFLIRRFFGHEITLCHYALKVWQASHYGSWHLYGHQHMRGEETYYELSCDVGVDGWNYRPVPFEIIKYKMERKLINQELYPRKKHFFNYSNINTKNNLQIIEDWNKSQISDANQTEN